MFIVLNVLDRVMDAVVDSISDVIALSAEDIRSAPELSSTGDTRHILGIGCVNCGAHDRLLDLIDITALVSNPKVFIMDTPGH